MAKKPETKFYAQLQKELSFIPSSWWQRIDISYARGIPDYLGCVRGRFVGLEGKTRTGQATKIQLWTLREIERAGGYARVVSEDNIFDIIEELRRL